MANKMVKSELIAKMLTSSDLALSDKAIELGVNRIINCIVEALSKGRRIELRGLGSFELKYQRSRKARNPKTGEQVVTAPKYSIHFKPGKELRERVNTSRDSIPLD